MKQFATYPTLIVLSAVLVAILAGCGGGAAEAPQPAQPAAADSGGLTAAQLENGIGPVTTLTLGPIDEALAQRGEESYTMKCLSCHKLDQRYVGPPLGDVLERRSPAYVMNMMLNPAEMVEKHPEAKAMLAQYFTPMPSQNLTEDEARALLEYLRMAGEGN